MKDRWYELTTHMPASLQQEWHGARIALGITRATQLLEQTIVYFNEKEEQMKEVSFGPVSNPDGTPTDFTRQMLEGTGRSLKPPFEPISMAEGRRRDWLERQTAERGRLEGEYQAEDAHLEAAYEDRFTDLGD